MNDVFTVTISAPEGVVFTGEAVQIEAVNSEGPFTIMADHARFVTVLADAPILIQAPDGATNEYTFSNAVLFFKDDTAHIYTQPKMA